jgi:hypothetical protein
VAGAVGEQGAVAYDCLRPVAGSGTSVGQRQARVRVIRSAYFRPPQQRHRLARPARGEHEDAQQMQGQRLTRLGIQDATISGFRCIKPAGLVQRERGGKVVDDTGARRKHRGGHLL